MAVKFFYNIDPKVFFKVISSAHINYPHHRRKAVPVRQSVGGRSSKGCFLQGGLINIPVGYPKSPNAFKDQCLIVSVIFGHMKLTNIQQYNKIKIICYKKSTQEAKNEAGEIFETLIQKLCLDCDIVPVGPYDLDILLKISNKLNLQIHLITSLDGRTPGVLSYPPGNDLTRRRLYLLLDSQSHIVVIDSLKTFFRQNQKIICFSCLKFFPFDWIGNRHRCLKQRSCFNCSGILLTDETEKVENEMIFFCNSKLENVKVEVFRCSKCNLSFETLNCFENHQKHCIKNHGGWKCLNCNVFQKCCNKTVEEIQVSHICGQLKKKCSFCYQLKEVDHICQIKQTAFHHVWPNLSFLSMKFQYVGEANCENCYQIRKKYAVANDLTLPELFKSECFSKLICEKHKKTVSQNQEPNVICMYREEKRFFFKEYLFCDDALMCDNSLPEMQTMYSPYSENPKSMTSEPGKFKRGAQNVSKLFQKTLDDKCNTPNKSALSKLLLSICSPTFSNYTFVMDANSLLTVLRGFINLNVTPSIIQKGNKILSMEVQSLKIRFLNSSCYLKGSIYDIGKQYQIPLSAIYFPDSWNSENLYDYSGVKPAEKDFFCFSDTNNERVNKKTFYDRKPDEWVMKEELLLTIRNETVIYAKALLCFLQQCFELQDAIGFQVKKKPSAIHPLGYHITSLSGFSYAVFCFYYMNDFDIFTVLNPYTSLPTRSSLPEYEYTSWLDWKYDNVKNAFNCFSGQILFGKHYVDAYSEESKTIYDLRGCEYHCHLPCLLPKNKDRTLDSTNFLNISMRELQEKDQAVNKL